MPLLISLLLATQTAEHKSRKKCTNIPEVASQSNAMFLKFQGCMAFFFRGIVYTVMGVQTDG
jgi:hypothetical protein